MIQGWPIDCVFPCMGNFARSILAEGILCKKGGARFNASSAGSWPKGAVNPTTLQVLEKLSYPSPRCARRLGTEHLERSDLTTKVREIGQAKGVSSPRPDAA